MPTTDLASVWRRLIAHSWPDLSDAEASRLLTLRFSRSDLRRMRDLGEKVQDGTITKAERAELKNYVVVGRLAARLKLLTRSKASTSGRSTLPGPLPRRERQAS